MQLTKLTEADLRPTIDKWNAHSGGITEVAAALKIPRTTLSGRLEAAKRLGMQVRGGPPVAAAQRVGRSVDEFKQSFDKSYIVPLRIKAALDKLGDGWQYEVEFAKLAEGEPAGPRALPGPVRGSRRGHQPGRRQARMGRHEGPGRLPG